MMLKLLALLLAAATGTVYAQQESRVALFPAGHLIHAPVAHHQEARIGVRKQAGSSRMKLEIGASMDVVELRMPGESGDAQLRFGIDFFTYALSTSSQGLRLQIDAVDGFFGGHVGLLLPAGGHALALRLRVLHLSGHFLDGHFDLENNTWKDGRRPIPFTRDFGELTAFYGPATGTFRYRAYAGISYATLVRPDAYRRFGGHAGLELYSGDVVGPVLGIPTTVYAAGHTSLAGVPEYQGTNSVEFGIKSGEMGGTGLRLYVSYYRGLEMFSQYFREKTSSWGVGFAFDR